MHRPCPKTKYIWNWRAILNSLFYGLRLVIFSQMKIWRMWLCTSRWPVQADCWSQRRLMEIQTLASQPGNISDVLLTRKFRNLWCSDKFFYLTWSQSMLVIMHLVLSPSSDSNKPIVNYSSAIKFLRLKSIFWMADIEALSWQCYGTVAALLWPFSDIKITHRICYLPIFQTITTSI